jgi:hypothetical protein
MRYRPWREPELKLLRDLWMSGNTGREIGRLLGRSTNSVLSKVQRMPDLPQHPVGPRKGRYAMVEVATTSMRCPCCGGPIEAPLQLEGLEHIQLPRTPRRILEALIKAYPNGVTYSDLANHVYWDSPTGGPTNYNSSLAVTVSSSLRPRIEPLGWSIGLNGGNAGIRLFKTEEAKEAA